MNDNKERKKEITLISNDNKERIKVLALISVAIVAAFIFSQSLPDSTASVEESDSVLEAIRPLLVLIFGEDIVTSIFVRKLAHFCEFFMLGATTSFFLWTIDAKKVQTYVNGMYFCGTWAFTDETIQIFTNRNPQIKDVWIDIGGALSGLAVVLLLRLIIRAFSKRSAGT